MMSSQISQGGFYFPRVYKKSQQYVERCFNEAQIDYADLTQWTFPDEFLCFVLETDLLKFVDMTYPNPRINNEVPIWFLITCQFLMRLHQSGHYRDLRYLLKAGSILTRFGYNVGAKKIGFNDKNKTARKTAVHEDTVRKFFKDTDPKEIATWYRSDLQRWFKTKRAFNDLGLFVLDQSHLVVPDNTHYRHAVKMPVDEHGQWYPNLNTLTEEQKQALVYHPCYTLSVLLNVTPTSTHYHIAGYDLGPGNEDELVQADKIVPDFCRTFPGLMKELIVDRGYIDGDFFSALKQDYDVNVLVPLKTSMSSYRDAIAIADHKKSWEVIACEKDEQGKETIKTEVAFIGEMDLWSSATCKQQVVVSRETTCNDKTEQYDEHYFVLASTRQYKHPRDAIERYQLRVQVEERFRQFKHGWYIAQFPSPHEALVESHVCFTLFTYSLLQMYLQRQDLQAHTQQMIQTLRRDERMGKDAVVVYSGDYYGVLDLDDCIARVADMAEQPRKRIKALMETQKEARLKREG